MLGNWKLVYCIVFVVVSIVLETAITAVCIYADGDHVIQ